MHNLRLLGRPGGAGPESAGGRWANPGNKQQVGTANPMTNKSRPLFCVHVHVPLSTRDETLTGDLSQFCIGNWPFTFFRPVSVFWSPYTVDDF